MFNKKKKMIERLLNKIEELEHKNNYLNDRIYKLTEQLFEKRAKND